MRKSEPETVNEPKNKREKKTKIKLCWSGKIVRFYVWWHSKCMFNSKTLTKKFNIVNCPRPIHLTQNV